MDDEKDMFTVGELKRHLDGLSDECIIHFSAISGIEPTFYRLKSWARDSNDNLTEVVFEFSEL